MKWSLPTALSTDDHRICSVSALFDGSPMGGAAMSHATERSSRESSAPFCGDIGLRIARDGVWFYRGAPIPRPALVRMFATLLRREGDRYLLATPAERVGIEVEDAPFVAVEMEVAGAGVSRTLRFRTNVDDWVSVGAANPMRFETGVADGVRPHVRVRDELWALLTRSLALDLLALCETRPHEGGESFGVAAGGLFFPVTGAPEPQAIEPRL
jgi:hypothetical protein